MTRILRLIVAAETLAATGLAIVTGWWAQCAASRLQNISERLSSRWHKEPRA